jgi:uncharacterized protein (DUF924 family)
MATPEDILRFWFADSLSGEASPDTHAVRWFGRNAAFDRVIAERFGDDIARAASGELDHWARDPQGRLALIILLDQFPRNAFRGSARAFALDGRTIDLCRDGLAWGDDRSLAAVERLFFYMPLLHSERRDDQAQSVRCFAQLLEEAPAPQRRYFVTWLRLARRQRLVIRLFGRFPHRNGALGRRSTAAEQAFLVATSLGRRVSRAFCGARRRLGVQS